MRITIVQRNNYGRTTKSSCRGEHTYIRINKRRKNTATHKRATKKYKSIQNKHFLDYKTATALGLATLMAADTWLLGGAIMSLGTIALLPVLAAGGLIGVGYIALDFVDSEMKANDYLNGAMERLQKGRDKDKDATLPATPKNA